MGKSRRNCVKTGAALLFSPALLSLNGCQNSDNAIKIGVTSRPRMLDPRKATDALSSRINRLIYRSLIDFDERFAPVADLATWEEIDPLHYRFTLLEQPIFHHGKKLSSEDVVATYKSLLDKVFGSAHRGSLKGILEVTAVDETRIDFFLSEPDPLFVGRLVIGILPADLIEQNHPFPQKPVGCGACEFVFFNEQKLILSRQNDHTELHFIPVKDSTVRVLKLRKGELDLVQNDLSPELVNYCQQQDVLRVQWHNGTNFGYVGFNFDDPYLRQLPLREAIAHAIDRPAIIEAMFAGHARLAQSILTPQHWCGLHTEDRYNYDPNKAKALLKQVQTPDGGMLEGEIELSYKTSNDPTRIRLATIYQDQLKEVGIHLNIQSYDWGTFYNDIKQGRFQLYSLAWVGVKSPDIFQYVFDSAAIPPKGANRGRYRDKQTDQLIRKAAEASSMDEQAKIYRELQMRLYDDLAALPLWYEDQYAVSRSDIEGYRLYPDGRLDGLLFVRRSTAV
ncbi:ABC transporter substrate-binding protein [Thiomicrorhabdus sp. HH1]|uniref:ABC transporter substrate-binding protein n=2 Tax=Thiomicrorhabdus heinhorstiae TaxID=2748010 RepID=A0ABS0BSK7_9GAMM|nr:ABC transporter substrate-binding protein [Thiomicrorhabdus heinhorstiae]